jgi:hypothetical protein
MGAVPMYSCAAVCDFIVSIPTNVVTSVNDNHMQPAFRKSSGVNSTSESRSNY